jgi:hypothetical protein
MDRIAGREQMQNNDDPPTTENDNLKDTEKEGKNLVFLTILTTF